MPDDQELRDLVADIFEAKPEDFQESTELESFAAYDSVARLSFMVALSDFIGRPVMVAELMELRTYADVVGFVRISSTNGNHA
jgi:acyl carrier protein